MLGSFLFFLDVRGDELAGDGVFCRDGVRFHVEHPGRVHALLVVVTQLALHVFANGAKVMTACRAGVNQETLAADGAANVAADIGRMAFDRHGVPPSQKP